MKHSKRVANTSLIDPDVLGKLMLPIHFAIELLPLGMFTQHHANELAKIVNVVYVDSCKHSQAMSEVSTQCGEILAAMFGRVKDGKNWNVTADERKYLTKAVMLMDQYMRKMTVDRYETAAMTVNRLNDEAKAAGYGFLDRAPVKNNKIEVS